MSTRAIIPERLLPRRLEQCLRPVEFPVPAAWGRPQVREAWAAEWVK